MKWLLMLSIFSVVTSTSTLSYEDMFEPISNSFEGNSESGKPRRHRLNLNRNPPLKPNSTLLNEEIFKKFDGIVLDKEVYGHFPNEKRTKKYLAKVKEYNLLKRKEKPAKRVKKKCDRVMVRKEVHDLTRSELETYFSAINQLHNTKSVRRPQFSSYDEFSMVHVESGTEGHLTIQFFPWHRAYIYEFEKALQHIQPNITLPYWDWTVDAYFPEKSDVLKYYGGSFPNEDFSAACVKDGPFGNWTTNYPYKHCIARGANLTLHVYNTTYHANEDTVVDESTNQPRLLRWLNEKELNLTIQGISEYESFESNFESVTHDLVHFFLAGFNSDDDFNLGDMFYLHSPNDPLFWLHHANVDRVYHQWQLIHDKQFINYGSDDKHNLHSKPSDIMIPWDYDVASVLDIDDLCYRYQPPIRIKDPNFRERYSLSNIMNSLTPEDLKLSKNTIPK